MSAQRYKITVLDNLGAFIDNIQVSVPSIKKGINGGDSFLYLNLPTTFQETPQYLNLNYEYKIYDNETGQQVYSGYVVGIRRKLPDVGEVIVELSSFAGRLEKIRFTDSGNVYGFSRTGSTSAETGSKDTGTASNQVKTVIDHFRFKEGNVAVQNTYETANGNFGSTTERAQSFTSGTDAEQNLMVGIKAYMKYNNVGNRANIDVRLMANNAGVPGSILAEANIVDLSNTTSNWIDIIWHTPYQLSASTKYWIQMQSGSASATNVFDWRRSNDGSNPYASGDASVSTNSGGSWTDDTNDDHAFKTIYVDESRTRINYTSTSIDASNDDNDWKFTDLTCLGALNYITNYAPADFFFYVDETNTVHFHRSGTTSSLMIDSCDSATGWNNGGGTSGITTSTTTKKQGTASVVFTLDGAATSHHVYKDVSVDVSQYTHVGPWVNIPAASTIRRAKIKLSSNSDTDQSTWIITTNVLKLGMWNWLLPFTPIGRTADEVSGAGVDTQAVTRVRLFIETTASSDTGTFYMDQWLAANLQVFRATLGRNVTGLEYRESIDELSNRFTFSNNAPTSPLIRIYENTDSISTYGLSEATRVDGRVTDGTTANAIGSRFLNQNSLPKKVLFNLVLVGINKNDVRPGYMLELSGFSDDIGLERFYVITEVNYDADTVGVVCEEVGKQDSDKVNETEMKLDMLESSGTSTGDTPTSQAAVS